MGSWNAVRLPLRSSGIFPLRRFLIATLLCAALFALLWGMWNLVRPHFSPGRYTIDGRPEEEGTLPLSFKSSGELVTIHLSLTLSPLTPRTFSIRPDDCLEQLAVNGETVNTDTIPFCDYTRGRAIDLTNALRDGRNDLKFMIRDHGGMGGLDVQLVRGTPLVLLLFTAAALLAIVYGIALLHLLPLPHTFRPLGYVFLGGMLLRVLTIMVTPYTLRGHDADGHLEYVQHLLTHWSLPDPHGGWEFYQPPLYYATGALWLALGKIFSPTLSSTHWLQVLSFLLTTTSFGLSLVILPRILRRERQSIHLLAGALLATLPGLVFFAPRINNDVLVLFLSFLSLVLLLWWNEHRSALRWYLLVLMVGLGILTKLNAVLLLVPPILLLLWKNGSLRSRLERLGATMLLLLLGSGWFFIPRLIEEEYPPALVIGNIGNLNSGLRLENTLPHLTVFSPTALLTHPFNNAWNDAERRQYFFEYLFRSAFFGEFGFDATMRPLATFILLLALFLLPVILWGLLHDVRNPLPHSHPLALLLLTLLLGALAYRIAYPYASSQDFRYSPLLALLAVYYLVRGTSAFPPPLRRLSTTLASSLVISCGIFLLSLTLLP